MSGASMWSDLPMNVTCNALLYLIDKEEDESVVIDILTHESEDDTSSTTSGSDGGCTSTSHKYEVTV